MASKQDRTSPAERITVEVDWEMADIVADSLGRATRELVAQRDGDAVRDWCQEMAGTMVGEFNATRGLSYVELAMVAGYRGRDVADRAGRDWAELSDLTEALAQEAKLLVEAVRLKEREPAAAVSGG